MLDKAKGTFFLQNPIAYSERPSGNNQSQCTMQSTQYFVQDKLIKIEEVT